MPEYHNIFMVLKTLDKLDIWNFEWVDLLKIHRQQISSN